MMYKISRYWNRIAFFVIGIGFKMIWDITGMNADILEFEQQTAKDILCEYKD